MAILENSPSARMQIRSRGQLVAPACCVVCGTSDSERAYLDIQAFVEFHGTVYFCDLCLTQGAETLGMFTAAEVKHLQDQLRVLVEQRETLQAKLDEANEYIGNFDRMLRDAFATGRVPDGIPDSDVTEPPVRPESGESEVKEPTTFFDPEPVGYPKLRNIKYD